MTTTQAMRPPRTTRRPSISTIAIVGALHAVVIYGLYLGLTHHFTITAQPPPIQVVDVSKLKPPPQPTTDPTRHIKLISAQGQTTIKPPIIDIVPDQPQGTTQHPPTTADGGLPVITSVRGIAGTHTIPDYPVLAIRLDHTGNVTLNLAIDERGTVVGATIEKSSGYEELDSAAVAWVIAHWRYEPATRDGKPVPASTNAVVTFRLTNRQG